MNSSVEDAIILQVAESIGISPHDILPETPLSGFPMWDSLAALSLLSALEEKYMGTIDPSTLFSCDTVLEIVKLINGTEET